MHVVPFIQDLAVILGTAGVVTLLFKRLRQPVVLGYLVAGILVGPYTPPGLWVTDVEGIKIWAELGVIFLMFGLGLEFNIGKLLKVGKAASITALAEVVFMIAIGFSAGRLSGWTPVDSLFLGAILAISSTAIIVKALEEQGLKKEKFSSVLVGILVVEDMVGILVLVALSTLGDGKAPTTWKLLGDAFELVVIVATWFGVGLLCIPRLMNKISSHLNDETLVLVSLALCLGLVVLAMYLNYSTALGAVVMGTVLAECKDRHRIEKLVLPIRDVFGAVFFVSIGMLLDPMEVAARWPLVLSICALTIGGKVVGTALGCRLAGQDVRTATRAGFGMAQIGEFSFIIAGLGIQLGIMSRFLYPVAVSVAILTTFTTPYLIRWSGPAAAWVGRRTR